MKPDPNAGLPDLRHVCLAVGARQLRKAVHSGRAARVYLAKDADPAMIGPLQSLCEEFCVPMQWIRSMRDLGRACGIEVGASAAAVLTDT